MQFSKDMVNDELMDGILKEAADGYGDLIAEALVHNVSSEVSGDESEGAASYEGCMDFLDEVRVHYAGEACANCGGSSSPAPMKAPGPSGLKLCNFLPGREAHIP